RRFVGVEFDDDVVDAVAGEGRQHVLDGVDPDVAFGKSRRAGGVADVFDARFDLGPAVQIQAAETNPGVRRRGQETHADPVPAVQTYPLEADGFPQSLLLWHGRHLTMPGSGLASLGMCTTGRNV